MDQEILPTPGGPYDREIIVDIFQPHRELIEAEDNLEYLFVVIKRLTPEEIERYTRPTRGDPQTVEHTSTSPKKAGER